MINNTIETHFNKIVAEAKDAVIAIYPTGSEEDPNYIVMASAAHGYNILSNTASTWGRARHITQLYFGDLLNLHSARNILYIEVSREEIEDLEGLEGLEPGIEDPTFTF